MASFLSDLPLGIFLFFLNIPFLIFGYTQIGKTFAFSTLFSITVLAIAVTVLHPVPQLTQDTLLATVFGGFILGMGVGLVVRYGGSMDGTEIVAIVASKKRVFRLARSS